MIAFRNLGSTCYLNVALQVLLHSDDFKTAMFRPSVQTAETERDEIWKSLQQMFYLQEETEKTMTNVTRILTPITLKNVIFKQSNGRYCSAEQHDMPEFFMYIIEYLHKLTNKPRSLKNLQYCNEETFAFLKSAYKSECSEFHFTFFGVIERRILTETNNNCTTLHSRHELFSVLHIPVTTNVLLPAVTLEKCIIDFLQPESLDEWHDEDNQIRYKKNDKLKRIARFVKFPNVLIIQLQKQHPSTLVTFEKDLYFHNAHYELFAICYHTGNQDSGHYTVSAYSDQKQCWVLYNDEHVSWPYNVVNHTAYCFFFKIVEQCDF